MILQEIRLHNINRCRAIVTFFGILLIISDGLGYYLQEKFGIPPLTLTLLALILLTACFPLSSQRALARAGQLGIFAILGLCWFLVQQLYVEDFDFLGYAQVLAFLSALWWARSAYAFDRAEARHQLGLALHFVLFILASYAVVAWITFLLYGYDISLFFNIPTAERYGYRPSLLSREPSWLGVSAALLTYACIALRPERSRTYAYALVVILVLSKSFGGIVVGVILVGPLLIRRLSLARSITLVLGLAAAFMIINTSSSYFSDRGESILLQRDGSVNQRVDSMQAAWRIASDELPLGVGYGNLPSAGVFGHGVAYAFGGTIPESYRGDSFVMIGLAELGGFALVLFAFLLVQVVPYAHLCIVGVSCIVLGFLIGTTNIPSLTFLALAANALQQVGQWDNKPRQLLWKSSFQA